jgi:hypothetical protein
VPADTAASVAHLPPVSTLFAAFLGNNPIQHLLEPTGVLARLPAHDVATLTGTRFFPQVIAAPFHNGLTVVFTAAAIMSAVAAVASILRGATARFTSVPPTMAPGAPPSTVHHERFLPH